MSDAGLVGDGGGLSPGVVPMPPQNVGRPELNVLRVNDPARPAVSHCHEPLAPTFSKKGIKDKAHVA